MLRDKATLGYIGLTEREVMVIQSIFRMTEEFHATFELPRENERRQPDVVFIDAGNAAALKTWDDFHNQVNRTAIPIFISDDTPSVEGGHHISRPLVLRKLMEVLNSVKERYNSQPESNTASLATHPQSPVYSLRILVVDDSLPLRTYMHQKVSELCRGRVTIDFAESGEDAIEQVSKYDYDLIFLDVVMTGIDGYKTCKWIKANKPTYVVMLTSRSSPFDKVRGAMSGCDTYLVKPPQDADLKQVITRRVRSLESEGLLPAGMLQAISI